jgi:hypothetical protein
MLPSSLEQGGDVTGQGGCWRASQNEGAVEAAAQHGRRGSGAVEAVTQHGRRGSGAVGHAHRWGLAAHGSEKRRHRPAERKRCLR